MENTKIISICGMERGDLAAIIANMLEAKKLRILVIDNSCCHDLFLSLHRALEERNHFECDRVLYMRNKICRGDRLEEFEKFDVVIINHGLNVYFEMMDLSDLIVLQTSYEPNCHTMIKDYIDIDYLNNVDREKFFVVYRDKPSGKVDEQYVLKAIGLNRVENELQVFFDEAVYNAYVNMLYNGANTAKVPYGDMRTVTNALITELVGHGGKKLRGKKTKNTQAAENDEDDD